MAAAPTPYARRRFLARRAGIRCARDGASTCRAPAAPIAGPTSPLAVHAWLGIAPFHCGGGALSRPRCAERVLLKPQRRSARRACSLYAIGLRSPIGQRCTTNRDRSQDATPGCHARSETIVNRTIRQATSRGRAVTAGCVYALVVYLFGFAFGAVRVFLVVPRLGATVAVLLEAPIILLVSWKVSRWSIARFAVDSHPAARASMGGVAFAVLMMAEFGIAGVVFGRSVAEQFAAYRSVPGIIGLAAQICFAALPLMQLRRS